MAEHAQLLAPYAEKYFAQLPTIWAAGAGCLRVLLGGDLFPYTAASPELLTGARSSWPTRTSTPRSPAW